MPFFKTPDGDINEYTEEFAEQVLRPQNKYEEVSEPKPEPQVIKKVSKKKAKKVEK